MFNLRAFITMLTVAAGAVICPAQTVVFEDFNDPENLRFVTEYGDVAHVYDSGEGALRLRRSGTTDGARIQSRLIHITVETELSFDWRIVDDSEGNEDAFYQINEGEATIFHRGAGVSESDNGTVSHRLSPGEYVLKIGVAAPEADPSRYSLEIDEVRLLEIEEVGEDVRKTSSSEDSEDVDAASSEASEGDEIRGGQENGSGEANAWMDSVWIEDRVLRVTSDSELRFDWRVMDASEGDDYAFYEINEGGVSIFHSGKGVSGSDGGTVAHLLPKGEYRLRIGFSSPDATNPSSYPLTIDNIRLVRIETFEYDDRGGDPVRPYFPYIPGGFSYGGDSGEPEEGEGDNDVEGEGGPKNGFDPFPGGGGPGGDPFIPLNGVEVPVYGVPDSSLGLWGIATILGLLGAHRATRRSSGQRRRR